MNALVPFSNHFQDFLNGIVSVSREIPDPFSDSFLADTIDGKRSVNSKVRGSIAEFREAERQITHRYMQLHAKERRKWSRTTCFTSPESQLLRDEEIERSELRKKWFSQLTDTIKPAFDQICADIAKPHIRQPIHFSVPPILEGPLARLAVELGALERRFDDVQTKKLKWITNRGASFTIVESWLTSLERDRTDAKRRVSERWFVELTPEQSAAFDSGVDNGPNADEPGAQVKKGAVEQGQDAAPLDTMKPSDRKWFRLYEETLLRHASELRDTTAPAVYDWLKDNRPDDELPAPSTFETAVSRGRKARGTPAHTSRRGRESRSIVSQDGM